jgi:hypothetical protein
MKYAFSLFQYDANQQELRSYKKGLEAKLQDLFCKMIFYFLGPAI